jgi:hypothetical protein
MEKVNWWLVLLTGLIAVGAIVAGVAGAKREREHQRRVEEFVYGDDADETV